MPTANILEVQVWVDVSSVVVCRHHKHWGGRIVGRSRGSDDHHRLIGSHGKGGHGHSDGGMGRPLHILLSRESVIAHRTCPLASAHVLDVAHDASEELRHTLEVAVGADSETSLEICISFGRVRGE